MFTDAECQRCRRDFPALARTHDGHTLAFLDGPAGTQLPNSVIDAISGYYRRGNANTHGSYVTAQECDEVIRSARAAGASFLGAEGWRNVSLGQNMTTLTFSLSRALAKQMEPGDEIVITALDHDANRGPWLELQAQGLVVREVALLPNGTLDYEDLEAKVGERTRLIAMGYASNALGTVNDVAFARRLSRDRGALLVLDAVHYAAHFPIDVSAAEPDFLLCSAYKFYGPHVGILYSRTGLLDELATERLSFGDQSAPGRIETGTLNHAALCGVTAAIEYIASWGEGETTRDRVVSAMASIAEHEHALARHYHDSVRELAGVTTWGPDFSAAARCPTVTITIDGVGANEAARHLGERGLFVWDGSFGAPRALEALGLWERGGALRTGVMMYNTRAEIDRLVGELGALIETNR